jgi:uncharacterized RDD family membrane protein YckC
LAAFAQAHFPGMTQDPPPEEPWQSPQDPYSRGRPPTGPYGQGQPPPPYAGNYGGEATRGGLPQYRGVDFGYTELAEDLAGRWRRLFAALLDGLLVSIVSNILEAPFRDWSDPGRVTGGNVAANLVTVVLAFVYFWLMHAIRGQTLGKMALKIRVVREDDLGAIDLGQSAARSAFSFLISIVTCGIGGIVDVAWILWDPRRQALHDKVAKTLVVKVDPTELDPYTRR